MVSLRRVFSMQVASLPPNRITTRICISGRESCGLCRRIFVFLGFASEDTKVLSLNKHFAEAYITLQPEFLGPRISCRYTMRLSYVRLYTSCYWSIHHVFHTCLRSYFTMSECMYVCIQTQKKNIAWQENMIVHSHSMLKLDNKSALITNPNKSPTKASLIKTKSKTCLSLSPSKDVNVTPGASPMVMSHRQYSTLRSPAEFLRPPQPPAHRQRSCYLKCQK